MRLTNEKTAKKMLETAQLKSSVREIESVEDLVKIAEKAVSLLPFIVPGMRVVVNPFCGKFPGSYNGVPEGTYFLIEHVKGNAWKVIRIDRMKCNVAAPVQAFMHDVSGLVDLYQKQVSKIRF